MGLYGHRHTKMTPTRDAPHASKRPADLRFDKRSVAVSRFFAPDSAHRPSLGRIAKGHAAWAETS